ncbi:MAG: hypothetical protein WB440_15585 [Steroidobacteraceae bacterium]|jgi:hypothetical protein
MNHWLTHTVQHLQLGEALVAGGVDGLLRGWRAPGNLVGKLCTGAERWQAAIRDMPVTANLAEILRARTFR